MTIVRRTWATGVVLALAVTCASGAVPGPRALRVLRERLAGAGRAEVAVSQVVMAAGDTVRRLRGQLTLELPDRVRVDDALSGERLTARSDGGEWLQPAANQMLILRPEQAGQVAGVWRFLLDHSDRIERLAGSGRFVLRSGQPDAPVDSLWVQLRSDGLPLQVCAYAGEEQWTLDFGRWRFRAPRGAGAFKLRAPAGYTVLEWP